MNIDDGVLAERQHGLAAGEGNLCPLHARSGSA